MKKLLFRLIVLGLIFCLGATAIQAATTDTFTITVTCNFISINLRTYDNGGDYTTWAIGAIAVSTATTMAEANGIMVDNTSNVATNLSAWVSTQASAWTNGAAVDANVYLLEMKCFAGTQGTPDLSTGTVVIDGDAQGEADAIKSGLAANTDQWAYAKLTTPSSTTSGDQQSITVTILAAAAS